MKLMVKDGVKRFVPDCGVEFYRSNGYVVEGEESPSIRVDAAQPAAPVEPVAAEPVAVTEPAEEQEEAPESQAAEEDQSFTCPHCGKSYKKESYLRRHITEKHPE